jgi:stage II sporulation protein D
MRMGFRNSVRHSSSPIAWLTVFLLMASMLSGGTRRDREPTHDHDARIGVLGLFHPRELVVSAVEGHVLVLQAGGEKVILEKSSGAQSAAIRISDNGIVEKAGGRFIPDSAVIVTGREGEPATFILAVPGKITRRYHGTLEIRPSGESLLAILRLDRESAVASVVAAESLPDTPFEALKAQAVAARSYFVSGRGRHREFDFCDTTHCQFLRELPPANSAAARAVADTRNLVLAYNSHPFPAMYTRSCSGRTRTPAELKMSTTSYPYFSVECSYCRNHPSRWSTSLVHSDAAALRNSDELSRVNHVRLLGWGAVPSNDFVAKENGEYTLLEGTGFGHGIGLCQAGARAMALEGANYRDILNHYYPNTTVITSPD